MSRQKNEPAIRIRRGLNDREIDTAFGAVPYAIMAGGAFEVWRRYADFNTGFFLALSGVALMALFISFVDVEPESRRPIGRFVYRVFKFLVTIAFASAMVVPIRIYCV